MIVRDLPGHQPGKYHPNPTTLARGNKIVMKSDELPGLSICPLRLMTGAPGRSSTSVI
jgi:hypothetical protein